MRYIPWMAEDIQALRSKLMKKEKLIKDVMRKDARATFQFLAAVRKEIEKEKNLPEAKLYLLYKVSLSYSPTAEQTLDAAVPVAECFLKLLDEQLKHVDTHLAQMEQKSRPKASAETLSAAQIPDIIRTYMETKTQLKEKIKAFVLAHRAGVIQGRVAEAVEKMKADGGLEKFGGNESLETFMKKQESLIVFEMVLMEMGEKTAGLDRAVNRIVEWRTKSAAAAPGSATAELMDQEKNALIRDLVDEINRLKEKEKLSGGADSGLAQNAECRAELAKLRSNVAEQKVNLSVICDVSAESLRKTPDGKPAAKPEEVLNNKQTALNSCDKIESLLKDERNLYLNFRQWESTPGQFLETLSTSIVL